MNPQSKDKELVKTTTYRLECKVKMSPKMEASEVRGVGDIEELIGTFS